MSLAPVAYLLFQKVMNQDPNDDRWEGRDRFILSPGHTSLTLYTQLFMGGYGLEMEDLESLRTWDALTPGHPEYKHTKGVEITTGPLGQGLSLLPLVLHMLNVICVVFSTPKHRLALLPLTIMCTVSPPKAMFRKA